MTTAFVLGGGGVLGAVEVGMLKALFERDVVPDLVLGTSVGALNGAMVARQPEAAVVDRLVELSQGISREQASPARGRRGRFANRLRRFGASPARRRRRLRPCFRT